jgi:hypothetical protein
MLNNFLLVIKIIISNKYNSTSHFDDINDFFATNSLGENVTQAFAIKLLIVSKTLLICSKVSQREVIKKDTLLKIAIMKLQCLIIHFVDKTDKCMF